MELKITLNTELSGDWNCLSEVASRRVQGWWDSTLWFFFLDLIQNLVLSEPSSHSDGLALEASSKMDTTLSIGDDG
jgi:hypothetical protein